MPKVIKEDLDQLRSKLIVTLEKSEYEPKFNSELTRFRNRAQLKGFRKGKVPSSFVKKMYGESIMADLINNLTGESVEKYLETEKIEILGGPIPAEGQASLDLDHNEMKDYTFEFEIGRKPDFELEGLSKSDLIEWHDVELKEEWIDEEMKQLRSWAGERQPTGEVMAEGDMIEFSGVELQDGTPKEEGLNVKFKVLFNNLSDEAKTTLEGKKLGDIVRLDVFKLEKNASPKSVRKYILELDENDKREVNEIFELTVEEVTRITPGELTQEKFDQYFGPDKVHSEEEARAHFKTALKEYYNKQADNIFFKSALDYLYDKNDIRLPDTFLKRWLKVTGNKISEKEIERDYAYYAESLKRRLITRKIVEKFDLSVNEEEILNQLKSDLKRTIGGGMYYDDAFFENTAQMVYKEEKYKKMVDESADAVISDKIFHTVKDNIGIIEKPIKADDFTELVRATNEKFEEEKAANQRLFGADEEE